MTVSRSAKLFNLAWIDKEKYTVRFSMSVDLFYKNPWAICSIFGISSRESMGLIACVWMNLYGHIELTWVNKLMPKQFKFKSTFALSLQNLVVDSRFLALML